MRPARGQSLTALALLLCTFLVVGSHAAAQDVADYGPIDSKDLKVLKNAEPVVVAGYRLALVVQNGIAASSGQGNSKSETIVNLAGVDLQALQKVVDQAHADLLQKLAATGRPVVPMEQVTASKGWGKLELTEVDGQAPYLKKPFADARTFTVLTPAGMPLWFGHFDTPLGDQGPMSLTNWRALNQLSVDTKAIVIVPQLAIDFATLEGSGHSAFQGSAETSAKANLRIIEQLTVLRTFHARIALAGEMGFGILKESIPLPDAQGKLVVASEWGNQDEVAFANLLSTNAPGGNVMGPGSSFAGQELAYIADPAAFEQSLLAGAQQFNGMIAAALAANRPGN